MADLFWPKGHQRMPRTPGTTAVLILVFGLGISCAQAELQVSPTAISLDRPEASQQILVTEVDGERRRDVTREARYEIATPTAISVHPTEHLVLVGNEAGAIFLCSQGKPPVELVSIRVAI